MGSGSDRQGVRVDADPVVREARQRDQVVVDRRCERALEQPSVERRVEVRDGRVLQVGQGQAPGLDRPVGHRVVEGDGAAPSRAASASYVASGVVPS